MRKFRHSRNSTGIVLVVTLLVLGIVIVLGYAFSTAANVALRSARNARNAVERDEALASGLQYALAVLAEDGEDGFDSLEDAWARDDQRLAVGAMAIDVNIADENGRLNVNLAALAPDDPSRTLDLRPALKELVRQAGGDDNDAQAIFAWLDPNTPGLHDVIAPKRPVFSLDALGAIPDLSPRVFAGEGGTARLDDLLATHTARINVNTVSETVLNALWGDSRAVHDLLGKRETGAFRDEAELRTFLEAHFDEADAALWESALDVSSDCFTVTVRAPDEAYRNTLVALVRRSGEDVRVLLSTYMTEEVEP